MFVLRHGELYPLFQHTCRFRVVLIYNEDYVWFKGVEEMRVFSVLLPMLRCLLFLKGDIRYRQDLLKGIVSCRR